MLRMLEETSLKNRRLPGQSVDNRLLLLESGVTSRGESLAHRSTRHHGNNPAGLD
jgi:hypothetical protein